MLVSSLGGQGRGVLPLVELPDQEHLLGVGQPLPVGDAAILAAAFFAPEMSAPPPTGPRLSLPALSSHLNQRQKSCIQEVA